MADKKKVYLFCSAGMSTSMLASNMQECADGHNLPLEVKAFPIGKIDEIVANEHPACVLLGPQVRHQYEETKARIEPMGSPVVLIDQGAYGVMDGEAVLKTAVKAIKAHKAGK